MSKILNEIGKSFKLINPKEKNGQYKKFVARMRKFTNCIFFPMVDKPEDIFTSMYNLLGPNGAKMAFLRYYYPRKIVFQPNMYVQPRTIKLIKDKDKKELVSKYFPGFRYIPKNRLVDLRNTIIDVTDIVELAIPKEKRWMIKPKVLGYVENIYPEFMSYFLFDNPLHDRSLDIEDDVDEKEQSTETSTENFNYFDNKEDYFLKVPFEDGDDLEELSEEAFKEVLMGKAKLFSLTGPSFGFSKYGFDTFIISIPFKKPLPERFLSMQYLSGNRPLLRAIKLNPEIVYPLSMLRFIAKAYSAYFNGASSDPFISELIKYNVVFHIYSSSGVGFCVNFYELKNMMKYNPTRFMQRYRHRLKLLLGLNAGTLKVDEVEKLADEIEDNEYEEISETVTKNESDTIASKFKRTVSKAFSKDLILNAVNKKSEVSEEDPEVVEVEEPEKQSVFKRLLNTFVPTPTTVLKSRTALDDLDKIHKKFQAPAKIYSIKPDDLNKVAPMSFSSDELESILNETTDTEDNETDEIVEIEESKDVVEEIVNTNEEEQHDDSNFIDDYEFIDAEQDDSVEEVEEEDYVVIKPKDNKGPIKLAEDQVKEKKLTKAEEKRLDIIKNKYKSISINDKPITEIVGGSANTEIDKSSTHGSYKPRTNDKDVLNLNLVDFEKSYIKNNYQADILNSVRSLSVNKEIPMYITGASAEDTSTQFDEKLTYKFVLEDENKKKHNITFDVPKISPEGLMKIKGQDVYIKKQFIRKPVVKTNPDIVYITTELNNFRVVRKGIALNKSSEALRRLFAEYLANNENVHIQRGNCEQDNTDYITSLEYDNLAKNYVHVELNSADSKFGEHVIIYFSQEIIRKHIKKYNINTGFENNDIPSNILPLAINHTKKTLYSIDMSGKGSVSVTIITLLKQILGDDGVYEFVSKIKTPKRRIATYVEIQSHEVPLITFLNYTFGWDRVSSYFPENEIEFSEKPLKNTTKLAIKFHDGYLYYNHYPINGSIFLNGLAYVNTEDYSYKDLNKQSLYTNFIQRKFGSRNIIKGWINVRESMLDFKTLQILEELNLPTDMLELFLYCNDLLIDNQVKSQSDISNYRIRGNEIISECIYKELIDRYNVYKKRTGKRNSVTMPQDAIMSRLYKTEILASYDALNPVAEIRNSGLTTFKGPGGTKLDNAFTLEKRAYDKGYMGVFGISTPDNKNAGIIKELSLNPKIMNTLGLIDESDFTKDDMNLNNVAPIAEALTPFVTERDDPSRVAFVSGQNQHVGGLLNASLPLVRTGVEQTIQYQVSDKFVKKAKKDGTVTDIDELGKKVFLTYNDGVKDVIDFGDTMLRNSDAFNQATYTNFVKVGQKIKESDVIAADERFFKVDPITKQLIYTQTKNAMVAIMEGSYTEEDSNLITGEFCEKISMNFTKCKQVTLTKDDNIISYSDIGDFVELGDPIVTIDTSGAFEDKDSDTEDDLISKLYVDLDSDVVAEMLYQTPKANLTGTITDIKVYWTCELNKMNKSIASFVRKYIKRIRAEITEEENFTGKPSPKRVLIEKTKIGNKSSNPRINGAVIDPKGGILIEFFISHNDVMSSGDKISLNSSLKTITAKTILDSKMIPYTESGYKLDGVFSWISAGARMINSIWYQFIGTILYKFSKNTAEDFLKEIGEEVPKNPRKV